MDIEQAKRRQFVKVAISETCMVFAVIALVVILILITSGYWINQNFEVERAGLLQVSSIPTGADLEIDGENGGFFQRTNTSKMVASGEHTVRVSREGYDSWVKTVNVREGLLYRLHYARLFLNDRTVEKIINYGVAEMSSVSPKHDLLLVFDGGMMDLLNLNSDKVVPTRIDYKQYFPTLTASAIKTIKWSANEEKVLIQTADDWLLVNLKNPNESLKLSTLFNTTFEKVTIADDSANTLYVVEKNNLRKVNISAKTISEILVENVINYDFYGNEIIYVATDTKSTFVGILSNNKNTKIVEASTKTYANLSKFYNDTYLTIVDGKQVILYGGKLPTSMDDNDIFEEGLSFTLDFVPEKIKLGHNGEFYLFQNADQIAVLDMEALEIVPYKIETTKFDWLDTDMIYVISDGNLIVYDYDGYNRREIAQNVSEKFDVTITEDKWLYYFSDGYLVRENLLPR